MIDPGLLLPPLPSRQLRVSVVMPTYRRPQQIGDSISSLLQGTFSGFELLVRDDGDGQDGTAEAVARAAAGDPRVRYHRNPANLRMPGNLNAGIRESRGEMIAVCHDHDLYQPHFLARMVETLDRNPTALFVHCGIELIRQDCVPTRSFVEDWPELTPGTAWLKVMLSSLHCPVCALTLVRRGAHEKFGLYDPARGFISDVEMWMRLSRHGDVAYVAGPLIRVREREADHEASTQSIYLLRIAASIHRQYLPLAYHGFKFLQRRCRLECRIAGQMVRSIAVRMRNYLRAALTAF